MLSTVLLGPGLVVLAAASVALGSVLVRRVGPDISTPGLVAWSTLLGAVVLHATNDALPSESLAAAEWRLSAIATLVYLTALASAVGYVRYFALLDRLGAIEINLVSYDAPIFAAVSGWLVLGESIDALTAVGFAVIFAGFALVKRQALGALRP